MNKRTKAIAPVLKLASIIPLRKPLRAGNKVYQDCVDELRSMLRKAERGELVGLAYAVMYSDGEQYFETSVAGQAGENKVFAAGMLATLSFRLMREVN